MTDDPVKESISKFPNPDKRHEVDKPIIDMSIADAKVALVYVRMHASEYRIAQDRIGLMGGSSGGNIAVVIAYNHTAGNRPDSVVPLDPYARNIIKSPAPNDAPPVFIAAVTDDQIGFNIDCVDLYKEWVVSKHSAELHIYSKEVMVLV